MFEFKVGAYVIQEQKSYRACVATRIDPQGITCGDACVIFPSFTSAIDIGDGVLASLKSASGYVFSVVETFPA